MSPRQFITAVLLLFINLVIPNKGHSAGAIGGPDQQEAKSPPFKIISEVGCATVDVSANTTQADIWDVAMNDANVVVFTDGSTAYKWVSGTTQEILHVPPATTGSDNITWEYHITAITAAGSVFGYVQETEYNPDGTFSSGGAQCAYVFGSGTSGGYKVSINSPYYLAWSDTDSATGTEGQVYGANDAGGFFASGYNWRTHIDDPPPGRDIPGGFTYAVLSGSASVFAEFGDSHNYFVPQDINNSGWLIGSGTTGGVVWKAGGDLVDLGSGIPLQINDQKQVIGKDDASGISWLWEDDGTPNGKRTNFAALLPGDIVGQLKNPRPFLISNANSALNCVYVVFTADEVNPLTSSTSTGTFLWTGRPGTSVTSGTANAVSKLILPSGISSGNLQAINSSGVISAIASLPNVSSGAAHAVLLLPVQLRLLNGSTTDFDGTLITKVIPAPENPLYDNDVWAEGSDLLGELPMGEGRVDYPGRAYACPIMVSAKAPSLPGVIQYRWQRFVTHRSWYIALSADSQNWYVWQRSSIGPIPDIDDPPQYNNTTPSSAKSEFYSHDSSGIVDSSIDVNGTKIGDYIYERKSFTYKVQSSSDGANWNDVTSLDLGQTEKVRVTGTSGQAANDWYPLGNSFSEGTLEPIVNTDAVRKLVGGSIPIVIDADANN